MKFIEIQSSPCIDDNWGNSGRGQLGVKTLKMNKVGCPPTHDWV